METIIKHQHIGKMLAEYFKANNINVTKLAYKMGMHPSTVLRYMQSESLQFHILWSLSIALKHNFLAELTAQLPPEVVDHVQTAREKQLETELEKTKFEVAIYKDIVKK